MGGRLREGVDKPAILGGTPVRATMLPYARQTVDAADIAAVAEALRGDWITQGPSVARFEEALLTNLRSQNVAILNDIRDTKDLSDATAAKLKGVVEQVAKQFA